MFKLSNKASDDLDNILDYSIINFGVEHTISYHQSLEKCFEMLDTNPDLGTSIDSIRPDYLYFGHRSHSIFYKKIEKDILIIRLLHKSMDVPQHL